MRSSVILGRTASSRPGRIPWATVAVVCLLLSLPLATVAGAVPFPSRADGEGPTATGDGYVLPGIGPLDDLGRLHLQLRARFEFADLDGGRCCTASNPVFRELGSTESEAWTLRTRLGYETFAWQGVSAFVEMENVASPADGSYFDGVEAPTGQTLVADPEVLELNRWWLAYQDDAGTTRLSVGRQRLELDDERFVGNEGWRQNEQTFDSLVLRSSLGIPKLTLTYAYLWRVHRIYGGDSPVVFVGRPEQEFQTTFNDDYLGDGHLMHASFEAATFLRATAFGYLLDFDNTFMAQRASADTVGVRADGDIAIDQGIHATYAVSYANQSKSQAQGPTDYFLAQLALSLPALGIAEIGVEDCIDSGPCPLQTPLGSMHGFNGWADAYFERSFPKDVWLGLEPRTPWPFRIGAVYHRFDDGDAGEEVDAYVVGNVGAHVRALLKVAYFSAPAAENLDRLRAWAQIEFLL